MNILELSTESSVQMAFIQPLAQHLRKQGHHVTLACSDDPGEYGQSLVEPLRRKGFEVLVIPMRRTMSPWRNLLAGIQLYRILRRRHFDVVHAQTAIAGMIGRVAGSLARVPVVIYTAHAFPFHEFLKFWRVGFYLALERFAARLCDVIVVDSECVRSRGLTFKVAQPDKIRVIPMGVDTERFDPEKYRVARHSIRAELGLMPDAVVIGAVGRFVRDKGWDTFLHAVSLLTKRFPDVEVQCLLVGGGPLHTELQSLSQVLSLNGRAVFAEYQRDIPKVMAALDIYMLPTRREGFGVTFIEAMSMEIPVIASRIQPLDEIVMDGRTGVLADVGDSNAFADAAGPLLADPELRRRMGKEGRRFVIERFEETLMCKAHEQLFQQYLGR
ncbi:MAG: glycosyltransferase family 4 protein [Nitrospiraceae bacterium]|nr:glycosyltransferase family 4 protein [Nitrospiraceae bacterium]